MTEVLIYILPPLIGMVLSLVLDRDKKSFSKILGTYGGMLLGSGSIGNVFMGDGSIFRYLPLICILTGLIAIMGAYRFLGQWGQSH